MKQKTIKIKNHIPSFLYSLFWEFKPEDIDIVEHSDTIMERIMERGDWNAMRWLKKTYTSEQIISYLKKRGKRVLPLRELNYWALISGVAPGEKKRWLQDAKSRDAIWRDRCAC